MKFLGRKFPRVFLESERNFFWWRSQTSFWTSSNAHSRMILLMEVLWFQHRNFWMVFTWGKWNPHANKFLLKKCCRNFMELRFFQVALRNRFGRVFARRDQEKLSQTGCICKLFGKGRKTILADELKTSFYQPKKLVTGKFFKLCTLMEVLWFLARILQLLSAKKKVDLHVGRVHREKCFGKSKFLEVVLSFWHILFGLAISNGSKTVHWLNMENLSAGY